MRTWVVRGHRGRSQRLSTPRGGGRPRPCGCGYGPGGFPSGAQFDRLASVVGDLRSGRYADPRGGWHLRPEPFQRSPAVRTKGTTSEAELHLLRARLIGGQLNKARRGELGIRPPLGSCITTTGGSFFDPEQQVERAVRLLFETFRRTGSLCASSTISTRKASSGHGASERVRTRENCCSALWSTAASWVYYLTRAMPEHSSIARPSNAGRGFEALSVPFMFSSIPCLFS